MAPWMPDATPHGTNIHDYLLEIIKESHAASVGPRPRLGELATFHQRGGFQVVDASLSPASRERRLAILPLATASHRRCAAR